jgi:thiamine pyrophosphate-dependent acetolactate synthase large subunit-like protein
MAATPTGQRPTIAAEAFLRALADHGTDYFFVNPGTDFPPIVEALPRSQNLFWYLTKILPSGWRMAPI